VSNIAWRPEPTHVAKWGDDLCVEVKCQTNLEIACSPRNSFRASVRLKSAGGRALDGLGGVKLTEPNQTPNAGKSGRAVGPWEMSFMAERERTQTRS
jgi:hypothetical protein